MQRAREVLHELAHQGLDEHKLCALFDRRGRIAAVRPPVTHLARVRALALAPALAGTAAAAVGGRVLHEDECKLAALSMERARAHARGREQSRPPLQARELEGEDVRPLPAAHRRGRRRLVALPARALGPRRRVAHAGRDARLHGARRERELRVLDAAQRLVAQAGAYDEQGCGGRLHQWRAGGRVGGP